MKNNNTPSTVYVIATTTLQSNSGREYPYALQFEVNPATGRVRVTAETECRVCVRPYQLLHLMAKVIMAVNPALIEGEEFARVVQNPANHGTHLALEYGAKRYRLDHEVGASWVCNPALLTLVRTLVCLKEVDPILYEVRMFRDYNWAINTDNLYPWEVWIQ